MNHWIERIKTHPIFNELITLEESVEAARAVVASDPNLFDAWERISRVVAFLKTYLAQIDPLLTPFSILNTCVNSLTQARGHLGTFLTNAHINYLIEVNGLLDAALQQLANIPRVSEPLAEIHSATEIYRENIGKLITQFRAKINDANSEITLLNSRIVALGSEVGASKERADNVIVQMQQQFSADQHTRQTEALAHETKRSNDFELAQENRISIHSEMVLTAQKIWNTTLSDIQEKHSALTTSLEESGNYVVETLNQQKGYAEKIVGIISTEAVAHGYGKTANEEREAAKRWRWLAVGTLIAWICAGVTFFALTYDKELSISALARQFLISTPFVLLSGFAALQVAKHQKAERTNRQQELEIAAIDPYLASFDEPTRKEVKKALAEKIFGHRELDQATADTKQILDAMSDYAKTIKQIQEGLKK